MNSEGSSKIDWRIRVPIWILALYAVVLGLRAASPVFLWLICSVILYILTEPLVRFLTKRGIPSIFAALAMVVGLIAIGGLLALVIHLKADAIQEAFSQYKNAALKAYGAISKEVDKLGALAGAGHANSAQESVNDVTKVEVVNSNHLGSVGGVLGHLLPHVSSLAEGIAYLFLCPILTLFFFADRSSIQRAFRKLVTNDQVRRRWWEEVSEAVKAYFLGNLALALASWPVFALAFYLFKVPSWPAFSVLAAVLNIIPFIGAAFAAGFPILDLMANGGGFAQALEILACCFAIHFLVANLVTPKILGSKVDVNAWASTVAIVAWGMIWGGAGLLLAVPLTAFLKISFHHSSSPTLQWISLLLSDDKNSSHERSKLKNPIKAFRTKLAKNPAG